MSVFQNSSILTALLLSLLAIPCYGQRQEVTVKIQHDDFTLYGLPIGWNGEKIALLRLDGQLSYIPAKTKNAGEIVATEFKPFSRQQLKGRLQKEFGKRYDVSITPNFVVVHPWGKRDIWADPFEEFSARFESYFQNKGITLEKSRFPQIVVVLRSRSDFDRHMNKDELEYDRNVGGYFSRLSNRMVTYDPLELIRVEKESWLYSSSTVIHESTHQSAFSFGLHNRFSPPPLWLSEGLAMLFEARGINQPETYQNQIDRVNARRFWDLKTHYEQEKASVGLDQLIAADQLFKTNTKLAYALAWGLSFYLSETQPEAYVQFLKHDGKRKDFTKYEAEGRLNDFSKSFGSDFDELEREMRLFLFGDEQDEDSKTSKSPRRGNAADRSGGGRTGRSRNGSGGRNRNSGGGRSRSGGQGSGRRGG